MSVETDVIFVGQMKPRRLTSLEEDFKRDREQFQKDELDRALRRAGKLVVEPVETTYERDPEET
ncbi:hypothetical protein POAN111098_01795 [Polynucleobacter antarcticus]|uniref:Uncharacterized protein n=2 Tax=Polynucleobacter antarcticus TaxID=1743162 RepID=A0A6M9Q2X0_9BURK|nr:hypothetical protein [Polynucleobacter antarcticus]QKM62703.1 hypothetical protein DCO16_06315 [Polynucleobacter antarcticus]